MVSIRNKALTSRRLAQKVAQLADHKKAGDIVILDMRGLVNFCDYFVLTSGTSDRQVHAIADGIKEGLSELGVQMHSGRSFKSLEASLDSPGAWVFLDMGDVVVHVFDPHARKFYGLEHLWQDASSIVYKRAKKKV